MLRALSSMNKVNTFQTIVNIVVRKFCLTKHLEALKNRAISYNGSFGKEIGKV